MAAQGQKGNLPRYDDDAVVLMRGSDLNKWGALIESWRPVAGENVKLRPGPAGTVINAAGGVAAALKFAVVFTGVADVVLSQATMLADYDAAADDDWSANFAVSDGEFTGVITYSSDVDRYPVSSGDQTHYRLPLVRDGVAVSSGGLFEEVLVCINGEIFVQLIKVG